MKIAPVILRTPIVDSNGIVTPRWATWLQEVSDAKMREVTGTTAPEMKKNEMIVFKAPGATYLVYYDGTHRYYWQIAGTDLF